MTKHLKAKKQNMKGVSNLANKFLAMTNGERKVDNFSWSSAYLKIYEARGHMYPLKMHTSQFFITFLPIKIYHNFEFSIFFILSNKSQILN